MRLCVVYIFWQGGQQRRQQAAAGAQQQLVTLGAPHTMNCRNLCLLHIYTVLRSCGPLKVFSHVFGRVAVFFGLAS